MEKQCFCPRPFLLAKTDLEDCQKMAVIWGGNKKQFRHPNTRTWDRTMPSSTVPAAGMSSTKPHTFNFIDILESGFGAAVLWRIKRQRLTWGGILIGCDAEWEGALVLGLTHGDSVINHAAVAKVRQKLYKTLLNNARLKQSYTCWNSRSREVEASHNAPLKASC